MPLTLKINHCATSIPDRHPTKPPFPCPSHPYSRRSRHDAKGITGCINPCGDETKKKPGRLFFQLAMFKSWRIASKIISACTRLWNSDQRLKNQKSTSHVRWSKPYLFPIQPRAGSAPLDRFGVTCVRLSWSEPQALYAASYTNHCSTYLKNTPMNSCFNFEI